MNQIEYEYKGDSYIVEYSVYGGKVDTVDIIEGVIDFDTKGYALERAEEDLRDSYLNELESRDI